MNFFQISHINGIYFICFLLFYVTNAQPTSTNVRKLHEYNNTNFVREIMRISKAAEMRSNMDETIDPCKNFYKFACGKWDKINPANTDEDITTGFFEKISKALNRKIAQILQSGEQMSDTEVDRKIKDFYVSCTKLENIYGDYKKKLFEIISEFGEMPALMNDDKNSKWNESAFDWLETVAKIAHKYGKDIIIGLDVLPDYLNNTVNRIYIGHPDFTLESRSMYLDNVTKIYRDSYQSKIMNDLTKYFGINDNLAKKTAKEILNFEVNLAEGMVDATLGLDISNLSIRRTSLEMYQQYGNSINITKLVNISLGEIIYDDFYEFAPDYQKNLIKVLQRTPKYIIANYIFFMLCENFIMKLQKEPLKQASSCIDKTKKYFAKNLDNMVYRNYYNNATENEINIIWNELKNTFKNNLYTEKLKWLDAETRKSAIEKLDVMELVINSYADDNFTEEYADLIVNNVDYVENIKNILEWTSKGLIEDYYEPPKPLEAGELLSYTPANIILENIIKLPVSLLQPYYLWSDNYPIALKFGTIGTLVGHELIHSFDDQGRKYDKDGNNFNWWDDNSTAAFVNRTECFIEQYSKYSYNGRYLPKTVSQSENIADNGGMRIAYKAYLKWYENAIKSGQNLTFETLPNMKYNSKQLFFISYAQIWCNDVSPSIRDLQTSTDLHVPGKYRVIGPLSNFNEFAEEFHCKLGTPMHPIKKCEIY